MKAKLVNAQKGERKPAIDPGPRPELTWLPVDCLGIDESYQRSIETKGGKRVVKRISEGFRWSAFGAILCVPNGPDAWLIIDGQHRVAAARQIGLTLVPAVVVHGIDQCGQAIAFASANGNRVPVSAQALFRAKLVAGDPEAVELKRICDKAGLRLLAYHKAVGQVPEGATAAIPALLRTLRHYRRPGIAEAAIATVTEAARGSAGVMRGEFFEAAARYLHQGIGDRDDLRRSIAVCGWKKLWQVLDTTVEGARGLSARINAVVLALSHAAPREVGEARPAAPRAPERPAAAVVQQRAAAPAGHDDKVRRRGETVAEWRTRLLATRERGSA